MKRREFALVIAMVASVGVAYAGAQTAPAKKTAVQKKTVQKPETGEKEEAGEKAEKQEAAEARLQLKDLPPVVRAKVEAETRNATLKGLSSEKANGKTVYEVETLVNGRTRDLMVDAAGKVYDVEEQLDIDKAPAPVKAAIEAKGKVVTLELATSNGKVHYEGTVQTKAGKKVAFDLDADGKPVKQ